MPTLQELREADETRTSPETLSLSDLRALNGEQPAPAAPTPDASIPLPPVGEAMLPQGDPVFTDRNPAYVTPEEQAAREQRTAIAEGPGATGTPVSRIASAAFGGATEAMDLGRDLGSTPGFDADLEEIRDYGIFNAPEDRGRIGVSTTPRDLLEGTVRVGAAGVDFVTRAVDVPFRAVTESIVQGAREAGVSSGRADQLRRDIEAMTFSAGMVMGASAPSQIQRVGTAQRSYARGRVERAIDDATEGMPEAERARLRIDAVEEFDARYDDAMRAAIDEKIGAPTAPEIAEVGYRAEVGGRVSNATETFRQAIIDRFDPINRMEETGRAMGLPDELQPYREFRLLAGAPGAIQAMQRRGTLRWSDVGDIEFSGEGLLDVFRDVADDIPEVQRYFAGRRAEELAARGIETPFDADEIEWMVRRSHNRPELEDAFNRYQEFNQRVLDFAVQSGRISQETMDTLTERGAAYVPFYRVMDDAAPGGRGGGNPLMAITGSSRNVDEIMENINRNAIMWTQASLENQAKLHLFDSIDWMNGNGMPGIARRIDDIPEEVFLVEREVRDALAEAGLADDGLVMALAPSRLRDLRVNGNPVEFVYRNGQRELWEVQDPLMARAIQSVNPESLSAPVRWLGAGPAAIYRAGVTLSPSFMLRNMIRDTEAAFIQSGGNFIPVGSTARGMVTRMTQNDDYWRAMANGAGFGTLYQTEFHLADTAADYYRRFGIDYETQVLSTPERIANFFTSIPARLGRSLEEAGSITEQSSRMREFQILRASGATDRTAALGARNVSTDFSVRGGSRTMRALTAMTPFLNARIQGFDRMAQVLRENPSKVMMRGFLSQTVPAVGLYQMNRDDPNYWALPDWVRDQHFVYIDYDDEGGHTTYLIPKAFEYGTVFGSTPERFIDAIEQRHGRTFSGFLLRSIVDIGAVDLPQTIAPIRDIVTNRNFTGAPVVPQDLEGVRASDQYREGQTSDTMIELARAMREETGVEISPMQAESLLRGYTGTLGAYALAMADWLVRATDPEGGERPDMRMDEIAVLRSFVRDDEGTRGSQFVTDFYDMLNLAREQAAVQRLMEQGMRPDATLTEREEWLANITPIMESFSRQMAQYRALQRRYLNDPDMGGTEKRERIDELQEAINERAFEFMRGPQGVSQDEIDDWRQRLQDLGVYTPTGEDRN